MEFGPIIWSPIINRFILYVLNKAGPMGSKGLQTTAEQTINPCVRAAPQDGTEILARLNAEFTKVVTLAVVPYYTIGNL